MSDYITVKLDKDVVLELFVNRVKFWTENELIINLYKQMYERLLDDGCFNGHELNVALIVDNDWANNCNIIDSDIKEDYQTIVNAYDNNEYEIITNNLGDVVIEALDKDNGLALVRIN